MPKDFEALISLGFTDAGLPMILVSNSIEAKDFSLLTHLLQATLMEFLSASQNPQSTN